MSLATISFGPMTAEPCRAKDHPLHSPSNLFRPRRSPPLLKAGFGGGAGYRPRVRKAYFDAVYRHSRNCGRPNITLVRTISKWNGCSLARFDHIFGRRAARCSDDSDTWMCGALRLGEARKNADRQSRTRYAPAQREPWQGRLNAVRVCVSNSRHRRTTARRRTALRNKDALAGPAPALPWRK